MTRIDINHGAIQNFATSPSGPVYRLVEDTARETERVAKAEAPVAQFGRVPGGQLRDSIKSELTTNSRGVSAKVSASAISHGGFNYATVQNRGRKAFRTPKLARFIGARDGQWVSVRAGAEIGAATGFLYLDKGLAAATSHSQVRWVVKTNPEPPFIQA